MSTRAPKPAALPRFGSLVSWSANTFYGLGQRVESGGGIYQASAQGVSGGVAPAGHGGAIVDGQVTWAWVTDIGPAWAPTTHYDLGATVTNDGGKLYECAKAGNSGAGPGPSGFGGAIVDGGCIWKYRSTAIATITEPTDATKDSGAVRGAALPADYFNWFCLVVYQWVLYLRDLVPADYGDGSDGSGTLDGAATVAGMVPGASTYKATRDLFFDDLTINAGIKLRMDGFRLYVRGVLTIAGGAPGGRIQVDGTPGVLGAGGKSGGHSIGGTAGILAIGGNGGNGGGSGAAGSSTTTSYALGGIGGVGGTGTGGAGGSVTMNTPAAADGSIRLPMSMLSGLLFGSGGAVPVNGGGGGGGGGGAAAVNGGGGGGGAGGVLLIAAYAVSLGSGAVLSAAGADGQSGNGDAGGGGGGGGGAILMRYHEQIGPVTPASAASVPGGVGGTALGAGGDGSGGAAGNLYIQQV